MNIQGQAALVTGGASGLGEATARELARLCAKVAVLDVNLGQAQQVAAEIGGDRLRVRYYGHRKRRVRTGGGNQRTRPSAYSHEHCRYRHSKTRGWQRR